MCESSLILTRGGVSERERGARGGGGRPRRHALGAAQVSCSLPSDTPDSKASSTPLCSVSVGEGALVPVLSQNCAQKQITSTERCVCVCRFSLSLALAVPGGGGSQFACRLFTGAQAGRWDV